MQFLSFDWLTGNSIRAHIPLTTNFVADTRQRKQLESSNIAIVLGVFNKTIIPLALVGHEIVIANSALRARGIIVNYLIFHLYFLGIETHLKARVYTEK